MRPSSALTGRRHAGSGGIGRLGFTLLEVVLVLVLTAAAVGLALPFFGGAFKGLAAAAAGRRTVSFLVDARARAMGRGREVKVIYNFENRTLSQNVKGEEQPAAIYELPEPVRVEAVERGGETVESDQADITFYPAGDSSGAVFICGDGSRRWTIRVGILQSFPILTRE